ncbi:hypothetical protein [Moellerella wisconsensis]|uniref:Uncharacterized protein n=2 Tax=Moellerella wisconsensis TaxID=158849 RepID=A0A9Q8V6E3_9GAMM|nr:hypothetical protein [Moellerella wisconsensis]UNH29204.1 hypothetical protein MNY64_17440 [Moellerella wisconsensis]UNH32676.1 hypothetical protein MNY72_16950 [Moellerella wisconsensis]UNH40917.1 hypothetical protein MNY70_17095 [Moellerella wisconsensis]UNH44429.1 hypothetical protein MNY66_16045 [Moellerella wisconsensis]WJW83685.1 hypothetical protein QU516_15505 [Moellerella wisconsensis]
MTRLTAPEFLRVYYSTFVPPNSDGRNTQEVTATVLLVLFTLFTKLSLIRKSAQIVYNPHEAGDEI